MKIIAIAKIDFGRRYIAEVDHKELEKFLGLYYGNLKSLEVGGIIDLGKGYDYHENTVKALKATDQLIRDNKTIVDGLLSGFSILGKIVENVDVAEPQEVHIDE